jgi:hypothetical protein
MNIRDKSILTGLYLSKFSEKGISELGFKSYQEAFNVLGFSLGIKPASIKNYRDEFDPIFQNNRKGWHKREVRDYCKVFYNDFNDLKFNEFSDVIKSFYVENYEIENFIKKEIKKYYSESVAKRLLTGKAAEEYFKLEYLKIDIFKSFQILDTTNMACGFDYKLTNDLNYFCIEVKGLNELKGNIQLTEKEFFVAQSMKLNYCLFIVKNFKEKPIHDIVFDPLNSRLKFSPIMRDIIQISYNASV